MTAGTRTAGTSAALIGPVLVVLGAACSATTTVDRARPPAATAPANPASTTVPETGRDQESDTEPELEPKEQEGPVTSTVTSATGSETRATVSTDAGQIRASYTGGELDVEIDSEPGWTPVVHRVSPTRLEVEWTSARGSVRTELEARDSGISTTTRSVATG